MKLDLVSHDAPIHSIASSGAITLSAVQGKGGQDPLDQILGPKSAGCRILFDLSKTNYVDSAGVSWFINRHKKSKEAGGCFVLHSVPPLVMQVLQLLHMDKLLHIAEDEATARSVAEQS